MTDEMRFVLREGRKGLEKLALGAKLDSSVDEPLALVERVGLEALIKLTGRPPLLIVDDKLDPSDPLAEEWGDLLLHDNIVSNIAPSVGRIDINGRHIGTGFMVAPDIIITNRHVLEAIALPMKGPGAAQDIWILFAGTIWIDFKREKGRNQRKRFRIKSVIGAGPDPIAGLVDFDHLDAALLQIETLGIDGGEPPPDVVQILEGSALDYEEGSEIGIVGYPGRPNLEPSPDRAEDVEVARNLIRLFQSWWGVKRYSPGRLIPSPPSARETPWVVAHDATTTGGASGSVVISTNGVPVRALGLHFAGVSLVGNYAHGLSAITPYFENLCGIQFEYHP